MGVPEKSETAKKLAILLPHLVQHNAEHAEDLEKWIVSAQEDGCGAASKEMKKAQALMLKIGGHLSSALDSIGGAVAHGHHYRDSHSHDHGHPHPHSHPHDHDHPHTH
jgi:hypothetical protein